MVKLVQCPICKQKEVLKSEIVIFTGLFIISCLLLIYGHKVDWFGLIIGILSLRQVINVIQKIIKIRCENC
jgi:heme O synthase-like polyprenyltransferase